MQARHIFLENLLETIGTMENDLEERDIVEPEYAIAKELLGQLKEELETMLD